MGYINASAEFQRHVNRTLGGTLWVECLAMVDGLVVANETAEAHRASMLRVFTRLARRQHSIQRSKLNILQAKAQYLGHISTEQGLKPTGEHVTAITEMSYLASWRTRTASSILRASDHSSGCANAYGGT